MEKVTLHREEEFRLFNSIIEDFRKYRLRLYGFISLTFLIAFIIIMLIPNEYTATTRLMSDSGTQTGKLAAMASSILPAELLSSTIMSGSVSEGAKLKGLFISNQVIDALLEHKYTNLKNFADGNLYQLFKIENKQYARDELLSRVTLDENIKSGILKISAVTEDPVLSSQIANECVIQLNKFKHELNVANARESKRFYTSQLKQTESKLAKIEEKQVQFLMKNRNYRSSTDPLLQQKVLDFNEQILFNTKIVVGIKQLLMAAETEINNDVFSFRIIETAEVPILKSGPFRKKYLLVSLFGSILFGFGLIVLKNAYRWYCPKKTREELASSVEIIRYDINRVVNRLRINHKEKKY